MQFSYACAGIFFFKINVNRKLLVDIALEYDLLIGILNYICLKIKMILKIYLLYVKILKKSNKDFILYYQLYIINCKIYAYAGDISLYKMALICFISI